MTNKRDNMDVLIVSTIESRPMLQQVYYIFKVKLREEPLSLSFLTD